MKKVILFADGTSDLNDEIAKQYGVQQLYGVISLGGKEYLDNITITPTEMFEIYRENKILPKTSAVNIETYREAFTPYLEDGCEIVVINLSSKISMAYENAMIVAKEKGGIYPVDSKSLSSGLAHLVIEAGELIKQGLSAKEVAERVQNMTGKVHATFVLDTLDFMSAGGRCSAVTAFGANLLRIKPAIEMDKEGNLQVTKKYRGHLKKVLPEYVKDQLTQNKNIRTDKIFVTYSSSTPELIDLVKKSIEETLKFDKVYEATASCTISTHCGPSTIGILFMEE